MDEVAARVRYFLMWMVLFLSLGVEVCIGGFFGMVMNASLIHLEENHNRNLVTGVVSILIFSTPWNYAIAAWIFRDLRSRSRLVRNVRSDPRCGV